MEHAEHARKVGVSAQPLTDAAISLPVTNHRVHELHHREISFPTEEICQVCPKFVVT